MSKLRTTRRSGSAAITGSYATAVERAVSSLSTTSIERLGSGIRGSRRSKGYGARLTPPLPLRESGIGFVVAPIPAGGGDSVRRIGPRFVDWDTVALALPSEICGWWWATPVRKRPSIPRR